MGQPSHWTYRSFDPADDLQQGDIIRRSQDMLNVLSEVLSHFCDERYTAFLVLTQSCDLVQRIDHESSIKEYEGQCKAEYINLCVIREIEPLLPNLLESCCGIGIQGVFASDNRRYAEQLLRRILNQNEQARGLFYLHPDAGVGIASPSVALLRVSIALRRTHYQILQKCRCGRLGPEYSAKLGWLTGNLYSRVASPDWEDQEKDKAASSKHAQSLLQKISQPKEENWVPIKWVEAAQKQDIDLKSIPLDRFRSTLAKNAPPELLDVVLESVQRVGRSVVVDGPSDEISKKIAEHNQFIREVAQQVAASFGDFLPGDEKNTLINILAADAIFCKSIADQVANLLKRKTVEVGEKAVNELSYLLTETKGILIPASNRLRELLSASVGENRVNDIGHIRRLVTKTCVFNQVSCNIAQKISREVFAQIDFRSLEKLVSRLRNDQKLVAACREQSVNQSILSTIFD